RSLTEVKEADRLRHAFRLCVARPPTEREVARLERLLADLRQLAREDVSGAAQLAGAAAGAGGGVGGRAGGGGVAAGRPRRGGGGAGAEGAQLGRVRDARVSGGVMNILPEPVQADTGEQRLLLHGVPWSAYVAIGEALKDRPGLRLTYDRGRLEFMTLSPEHE